MITAEEKRNRYGSYYTYYHCTKKKKTSCSEKSLPLPKLEEQIEHYLSNIEIIPEFEEWAIENLHLVQNEEERQQQEMLKNLTGEIQTNLNNIQELRAKLFSSEGLRLSPVMRSEYEKALELALKQQDVLVENHKKFNNRVNESIQVSRETFNFALYANYHFKHGDIKTKREILQALGSNFVIQGGKLSLEWDIPFQKVEKS